MQVLRSASAVASVTSATTASADRVIDAAVVEYRTGFGRGAYGANAYGFDGAAITITASASVSAQRLREVEAPVSSAATVSIDADRERNISVTAAAAFTTSVSTVFSVNVSVSSACAVTSSASLQRVRLGSALAAISCIVSAASIKKWEPVQDTAETWTPQSDTGETWTPVSDTAEIWTEAA
jgi:hypothetical protein